MVASPGRESANARWQSAASGRSAKAPWIWRTAWTTVRWGSGGTPSSDRTRASMRPRSSSHIMDSRRALTSDSDRTSAHQTLSSAADVMGVDERGVDGMVAASSGTGTVGAPFHRDRHAGRPVKRRAQATTRVTSLWTTRRPRRSVTAGPSLLCPKGDTLHTHTSPVGRLRTRAPPVRAVPVEAHRSRGGRFGPIRPRWASLRRHPSGSIQTLASWRSRRRRLRIG
jgi:hypothetical protein